MRRDTTGFTIVELCIAVAVLAIASTVLWPAYHHWFLRQVAAQTQLALINTIHAGADWARKIGGQVRLCGSATGLYCDGNWSAGFGLLVPGRRSLLAYHSLVGKGRLDWRGSLRKPLIFEASGRPESVQGGWHYSDGGTELFHLVVLRTGSVIASYK